MKKNVLITGASGLLGNRAVEKLNGNFQVHAVVRQLPKFPISNVIYHQVDLGSDFSINSFPSEIEAIFHFAQSTKLRDFPQNALDIFSVNTISTLKLLEYGLGSKAKHFVLASTGGLYGFGPMAFNESSPLNVQEGELKFYFDSKYCSETIAKNFSKFMNVIVLRPFFIYGNNQRKEMLIPRIIDRVQSGLPIFLQGERGIRFNPIHVDDAVRAIVATLNLQGSHIINIAGNEIVSIRQVAEKVGAICHRPVVFEYQEGEARDLIANIDVMKEKLLVPSIGIEKGLLDFF